LHDLIHIVGGAGSIGIQIAKAFGASEVITTMSAGKIERAKEILPGVVDTFIDYKKNDVVKEIQPKSLDFIFDTTGANVVQMFSLLKPGAHFITIATLPTGDALKESVAYMPWYVGTPLNWISKFRFEGPAQRAGINYNYHLLHPNGKDLGEVGKLIQEGRIKPVVGEVFAFTQEDCRKAAAIVQGNGSKNGGKVVIKIVD